MRIVGIFLIILMAFNVVASAHIDTCDFSTSSCDSSVMDCDKLSQSQNSSEESKSSESSSHNHCNTHCSHQCIYFQSANDLAFNFVKASVAQSYSFIYSQTSLEGLFRPPLV